MIDKQKIAQLRAQKKKGDLQKAAQIYHETVKKTITPRYLAYFLRADRTPQVTNDTSRHQPIQMYAAIAQAIADRRKREIQAAIQADKLLQKILHDTAAQPIAL